MSLTIIIKINELSREFQSLLEYLKNKVQLSHLIINTINQHTLDFCKTYYPKYIVTGYQTEHLRDLIKQISTVYKTDRYFALSTVNPSLTKHLSNILNEFDESSYEYGIITYPLSRTEIVTQSKLDHTINQIDHNIFYYNSKATIQDNFYINLKRSLDYYPKTKLVSNIVLITGSLGGIGLSTANYYYQQGWQVIGLDIISIDKLKPEERRIFYQYYQMDLSVVKHQSEKFNAILKILPRLDNLIHIAGYQVCNSITNTHPSRSTWDKVFNVNLRSIYMLTRLSFDLLKKSRGSIVVISSVHAFASSQDISLYAISKSALLGLVRNFAIEWGKYGIRINGLAPGAIDTPMLRAGLSRRGDNENELIQDLESHHLMGKIGQPQQIANSIYFLGDSTQSGFMTGQTVIMDGGASILLSTEVS